MGVQGPFHPGEREAQRRAGVAEEAETVGAIIGADIVPAAARFLKDQRLAIAGSLDAKGRPWASVLSGPPGFLQAVDERLLRIAALPPADDPLLANLRARPELALVVIDPPTRRRMRFNGKGLQAEDALFLHTRQVYGNCPKYIRTRRIAGANPRPPGRASRARGLDAAQQATIAAADTFFIASFHPAGGPDVSHRGGAPGFVSVVDARRLEVPDYPGNAMFNTLGNVLESPGVGLLFVDFERGSTLQLTGRGTVRFEPERVLAIEVDEVRETADGHGLEWEMLADERSAVR
jgi:predicted pyridoxine 5'-phosphate oxidase superfamily flavin-nucleotide-binding protein